MFCFTGFLDIPATTYVVLYGAREVCLLCSGQESDGLGGAVVLIISAMIGFSFPGPNY